MNVRSNVLIVDPDEYVHQMVTTSLVEDGYTIYNCYTGQDAMQKIQDTQPELILMEVVLPDMDGVMICQQIRKESDVPILFISEKCSEMDKIVGLTAGADDYIAKPFGIGELIARIKAHIRRSYVMTKRSTVPALKTIQLDSLLIDVERCTVEIDGQMLGLSSKEFKLLVLFAQHPGRVFQPEEIYRQVWGYDGYDDFRTVAVHISTLRKKMKKLSSRCEIQNIRGLGYKLQVTTLKENVH